MVSEKNKRNFIDYHIVGLVNSPNNKIALTFYRDKKYSNRSDDILLISYTTAILLSDIVLSIHIDSGEIGVVKNRKLDLTQSLVDEINDIFNLNLELDENQNIKSISQEEVMVLMLNKKYSRMSL